MAHQVIWTKTVTQFFENMANLNDTEKQILRARIAGMTRQQMSHYFSMSVRSIDIVVARLKRKYDQVQKEFPDDLKPRRSSVYEKYQDEN